MTLVKKGKILPLETPQDDFGGLGGVPIYVDPSITQTGKEQSHSHTVTNHSHQINSGTWLKMDDVTYALEKSKLRKEWWK